MTDMMINKLPSKTWNWLKVNETKLPWDMEHTTVLPEENVAVKEEPVYFSVQGEGEYSSKKFNIHAAKDEQITVYMDYTPENKLAVYTSLTLARAWRRFEAACGFEGQIRGVRRAGQS